MKTSTRRCGAVLAIVGACVHELGQPPPMPLAATTHCQVNSDVVQ
ncbi:MAG: hypothetical protein OEQ39_06925 [Gammaproteobacteria bacterium]|nr:hypothetical protein [Gammaproteobacteria bacterium]MDH3467328.1 hypothetical protein [Gammaproteobacteria bacterium]